MSEKTWMEMTDEERAAEWRAKFPNAKHPMCPWCELPHEPAPVKLTDGRDKGEPDPNCCNYLDARLTSEDFARLRDRFDEILQFVGARDYDSKIGRELFQGDWWSLMMQPQDGEPPTASELGANCTELLKRLARIRRELVVVRALAADLSLEFGRESKTGEEHFRAGRTGLKAQRRHDTKKRGTPPAEPGA